MNENLINRGADQYLKKYRPLVEALESNSLLSKVRSVRPYDVYCLGKQLEMFEQYKAMCEDEGTVAQLGKIPTIALDIITATYGTSPLSVISSTQPIGEESGLVYFKQLVAQDTRGNVTSGDMVSSSTAIESTAPVGYASGTQTYTATTTVDATLTYSFTLPYYPVRPGSVAVTVGSLSLPNSDNGSGYILGYGISGTINYTTGAVSIVLTSNPGAGLAVSVDYATNFEGSTDIPQMQFKLTTKQVTARVFALKSTIGLEQSYSLRQRFGRIAEDEVATDLVSQINAETMNIAVSKILANAGTALTWSATPDAGVAYIDHKQALRDQIAKLESTILGKAGRGTVNVLIAGRGASSILQTLPGFVKISDGSNLGAHIFGTIDGITVVRVPNSNVLGSGVVLALYNGSNPFESAFVYAPYMPLVVTTALPTGQNPLLNQRAAAVWAATEVLVPNFIAQLNISNV